MRKIGGKKVCWNFRKGRCRFGHKCTFAHDSDIKLKEPTYDDGLAAEGKALETSSSSSSTTPAAPSPSTEEISANAVVQSANKKKRPGLSQGIEPSKKAMKFHNQVYNH